MIQQKFLDTLIGNLSTELSSLALLLLSQHGDDDGKKQQ
jgi:hypothetical protein